jgi:hypothetical protein
VTDALLTTCMAWMDERWDDEAALLWAVRRDRHLTRDTAWYALGLLQRGGDADVERARRALHAVIDTQFVTHGAPYDGTFRRAPEEPDPPADPVMWVHYDPNWRQFIGTTFALICDRFSVPRHLEQRMRQAIDRAVAGEPDDRVAPTYANIALMKAWLDAWAGHEDRADAFAHRIAGHFAENGTFLEYNSPTYYGINLFALALWRTSTSKLASLGAEIEKALWRDIARFYHAGLRNVCGPYDRAYGMDMTSHATPLGLWIWSVVGQAERAPFPDTSRRFSHPHDICFAPCVAAFDALVPDDALPHLTTFSGERTIQQTITGSPSRIATAWLSDDVMLGAQTGPPSGIGWFQHHHATIHWRRDDASIGWTRLRPDVVADATARPGELRITTSSTQPIVFDVHPEPQLVSTGWSVDGLDISVETDALTVRIEDGAVVYEPAPGTTTFVVSVD